MLRRTAAVRTVVGLATVAALTACSAPLQTALTGTATRVLLDSIGAHSSAATPDVAMDELQVEAAPPHAGAATAGTEVDPSVDGSVVADRSLGTGRVATEVVDASGYQTVGVTWPSSAGAGAQLAPEVRTRTNGAWSGWTPLTASDSAPDAGSADAVHAGEKRAGTDSLWVGDVDAVQLSVAQNAVASTPDVRLAVVGSPVSTSTGALGLARTVAAVATGPGSAPAARTTMLPAAAAPSVVTRAQWGAAAPTCAMGTAPLVGAVLHHTADSNGYSSQAEAMALIRNDQTYHMQGRGWCDLGYNFVVDKWGTIYEGRAGSLTSSVVGVHAGGFNTGTVGIAMLGTYGTVTPSSAVVRSVAQIIGWKLQPYGVDPTGTMNYYTGAGENSRYANQWVSLPRVFGHRDVAYTACPGDQGYAALPAIRQLARGYAGPMFIAPSTSATSIPIGGSVSVSAPTISNINWRLTVTDDRTGVVMFTSIGLATEAWGGLVATWNGTAPSGRPVGPGPYRLAISGTDSSSGQAANTYSAVVQVTGSQSPTTVAAVPVGADLTFVPVTPIRLLDTRPDGQSMGAASRLDLVVAGIAGIPADAKAVALNVTAVSASSTTFLRVWPAGQAMPGTSNLNPSPGRTVGAGVISAVGGEGKVSIYNNTGSLHVVVDVTGYFAAATGSGLATPGTGVRVYDSRQSGAGRLTAGSNRVVQVTGTGGIPVGATAVVANVTSVLPLGAGNITAYPASGDVPNTASVNHQPGDNVSNRTIIPLDASGRIALALQGAPADVVIDVVGWFAPSASLRFTPIVPERAVDTRSTGGPLGAGQSRTMPARTPSVPADAVAALVSVAATQQTDPTYLTAWGSGPRPSASDLNTGPGRDQANSTIVDVTGPAIQVYNDRGSSQVIVDTLGFFR